MQIEIDTSEERLIPWDLEFKISGRSYRMREPTIAFMSRLGQLLASPRPDVMAILTELFEDGPPDMSEWPVERAGAVVKHYLDYMNEWTAKLRLAMAERSAAAGLAARVKRNRIDTDAAGDLDGGNR